MLNIFVWGLFLIIVLIILLNVMSSVGLTKNQKEIFLKDFENFLEKNCGRVSQFKVTEQTKKYCLTSEEIEKVSTGLSYFFLGEEEKIFYLFQDKYYFYHDNKYFYFDLKVS